MMQFFKVVCCGLIILFAKFPMVFSQNTLPGDSGTILFKSEKSLELTIELDLDSLYKGGFAEQMHYHGSLKCLNNDSNYCTIPVYFTKRGHFRRRSNVCDFPPLWVHFHAKSIAGTPFEALRKIKMITHCQNNDTNFNQYVIQEYLFYKVYNIITDHSFKVRLAKIKYVDLSGNYEDMEKYAFFLENPEHIAQRLDGAIMDIHDLDPPSVDPYYFSLMSLFQYVIGNQDWSVSLLHNILLVGIYPSLTPVTIPFDFDISWLINIPYNHPTISYRLGKKFERKFLPEKINRNAMKLAILKLREKREEILSLYHNTNLLSENNKIKTLTSLEEFFQLLENKKWVRKEFMKHRR
jgi:hypothetical protein